MAVRLDENWVDWVKAKELMKNELMEVSFNTWIEPLTPVAIDGQTLYIRVPSHFTRNFIEPRYTPIIENAFLQAAGLQYKISFVVGDDEILCGFEESGAVDKKDVPSFMLDPKYTFEAFVVGNSNRFAHAAALAVAEAPANAYNPLFIYGGPGLGKTHLMHAIGHYSRQQNPDLSVLYVPCERFTNEMIKAIGSNTTEAFRMRYRSVDILLIDDVHFLAGKVQTQEEFFHTFNELHSARKQIILSSDKPPREISKLEERLRSRFEWGLIADIQPPDLETRIAILQKKAEAERITHIDNEVLEFIAVRSESNIRELEGALTRVIVFSKLVQQPITLPLVQEALKNIFAGSNSRKATPLTIMTMVCERFGLTMDELKSQRRNRDISYPRQIAMYLIREMTDLSLSSIGDSFGGKDHTTVLHAWRSISKEMGENHELRSMLAEMRRQLQGH
ncbi:MAG: chromosomal replication initiator protein DnaA [Christensenellales bacterium]